MVHVDAVWDRLALPHAMVARRASTTEVRKALTRFLEWHYADARDGAGDRAGRFAPMVSSPTVSGSR